jgi:cyclopropane fatty-acyl-phospholipid synthase-like methyltransferase
VLKTSLKKIRETSRVKAQGGTSNAGVPLPPTKYRMGGRHFVDNSAFVASAVKDVERLADFGLKKDSSLLDWGCGAGRLAIGLLEKWGGIAYYHGMDVQKPLGRWAEHHLARPGMDFSWVDVANARYNPDGSSERRISVKSSDYDAFYAYSVLSHMDGAEVAGYLVEIKRLLRPNGFALVTAFVEDDVSNEMENPTGYGPLAWVGPMHCVRFSREFFDSLIARASLTVAHFEHGQETDGQSLYVLRA